MASKYSNLTVKAYRRENGRVGVRNHVVILPVDDISNAACEAVANNVKGTLAIPHAYGRLQFGEDLELHFRTMIGTGSNPNVHSVVVIGIEPGWTKRIADGIRETGKEVAEFHSPLKAVITPTADFVKTGITALLNANVVAAVILLVGIVAAIGLTMRRRPETKYQDPGKQVNVKAKDRLRVIKMDAEG